jgi:hypothetical protein
LNFKRLNLLLFKAKARAPHGQVSLLSCFPALELPNRFKGLC